jgi:alanyl-tRNA synthetase
MALTLCQGVAVRLRGAHAFGWGLAPSRRPTTAAKWSRYCRNCSRAGSWAGLRSASAPSAQGEDAPSVSGAATAWDGPRVRNTFIDFFADKKDHVRYPSSPVVPMNDPTLLFANAGMNQFKPVFLGQVDPRSPLASIQRAVNSQKCIRAGGKHNDLEDVGKDTYHHTFFEMLGTWSFGDYFKEDAIGWAWELLTEVYGLPPDRLYATYFGGDETLGLPADEEARDFWLRVLPADHVLPGSAKDNFWEMGDVGPCGPCSELHFDRIGGRNAASLVNMDDPDVLEIWNLVFIQFNREEGSKLRPLPSKHIDTGMGLERLVSVLQDVRSNYDTDLFLPLFRAIRDISGAPAYTGLLGDADVGRKDTAYRVVADHARTLAFAIADGAVPSNEGRGYVLRRVLRRAVRFGQQILAAPPGFFSRLIPVVAQEFGDVFPELREREDYIVQIVKEEEDSFGRMLERGVRYLGEVAEEQKGAGLTSLSGDQAFFLYDTMGFPLDLTQLMAEEMGLGVDVGGFDAAMAQQKERSRAAAKASRAGGELSLELGAEETSWLANSGVPVTVDEAKYRRSGAEETKLLAIYSPEGGGGFLPEARVEEGGVLGLILASTSFYAESGGQVADTGIITVQTAGGDEVLLQVTDVQSYAGYVLHSCRVIGEASASLSVADAAEARVDYEERARVAPNHTMTHVLNFALREVLGGDVDQRGSLVTGARLRFDFTNPSAVPVEQLQAVELMVQECIDGRQPVHSDVVPLEKAKAIPGLRAVFGEVYPDPVRVISVGNKVQNLLAGASAFPGSVEFCGGTHVQNTGEATAFVITEETAVAKGIRRISAVTGDPAVEALRVGAQLSQAVAEAEEGAQDAAGDAQALEAAAVNLRQQLDAGDVSAVLKAQLRARIEALQRTAASRNKARAAAAADKGVEAARAAARKAADSGKKWLVMEVDIGADSKAVKRVLDAVGKEAPDLSFMGISAEGPGHAGKLLCFAVSGEEAQGAGVQANVWVQTVLDVCGGRGGGRPNAAQGQAPDASAMASVLDAGEGFASERLS